MGRKTESSVASTSNDETSSFLPEHQHTGTRNHKNRALAVFGEYMRYFSGVNSLYRNIVHLQAEVVSKHGRRGWKSLSQEDQDIALNRHIIDNSKIVISFKTNSENEENITTEGHSENEQISRSGSLQSISVRGFICSTVYLGPTMLTIFCNDEEYKSKRNDILNIFLDFL